MCVFVTQCENVVNGINSCQNNSVLITCKHGKGPEKKTSLMARTYLINT